MCTVEAKSGTIFDEELLSMLKLLLSPRKTLSAYLSSAAGRDNRGGAGTGECTHVACSEVFHLCFCFGYASGASFALVFFFDRLLW